MSEWMHSPDPRPDLDDDLDETAAPEPGPDLEVPRPEVVDDPEAPLDGP